MDDDGSGTADDNGDLGQESTGGRSSIDGDANPKSDHTVNDVEHDSGTREVDFVQPSKSTVTLSLLCPNSIIIT